MKKVTYTASFITRQVDQAKADRKAEAASRRADRKAGIETVVEQNRRLYSNIGR